MDNIIYTKEEIINLIKNNDIKMGYTIERIADGVFAYDKIECVSMEDYVKQNKEEILEILNNLK